MLGEAVFPNRLGVSAGNEEAGNKERGGSVRTEHREPGPRC